MWSQDVEGGRMDPPPKFKEVVEKDIIDEVHKRKFANLIIQGEAKNTKHILHSEEVEEGLDAIYGTESEDIFKIWDEMTKIADQLDWIIPAEVRAKMMERMPDGIAGACFVDWKNKEKEEEEEETDTPDEEVGRGVEKIDMIKLGVWLGRLRCGFRWLCRAGVLGKLRRQGVLFCLVLTYLRFSRRL